MIENRFYICEKCGNIIGMVHDSGVPMMCCLRPMTKLEPGTVDASKEKHVPVITIDDNLVRIDVGAIEHPMTEEHNISWIYLLTDKGGHRKALKAGDTPVAIFSLYDEKPIAAYAYCNLHGLWMDEVEKLPVCDLKPVDTNTSENYVVCKCNNVSYFDILDAIHGSKSIDSLLDIFENVKKTTKCSTGCGGCYDKVIKIVSESMSNG
jgi:superoxide reductase